MAMLNRPCFGASFAAFCLVQKPHEVCNFDKSVYANVAPRLYRLSQELQANVGS